MASESLLQFQRIMQDLRAKRFAPVYLLYGEETYFIDEICDFIEKDVLQEQEKGFNQSVFYARDTDIPAVLQNARRFPMMADKQVLIVKEAQAYKSLEGFENYFEKPVQTTILVICIKGKKIDRRTKLYKNASSHVVFESRRLFDNELPGWISAYLKSKGYTINARSSALIADALGADLSKISNELEKLFINKKGDTQISEKDIEDHIGISKEFNNFELLSAIASKNTPRAFYISYHLSRSKSFSIIPFLAQLNNMLSRAYILKQTNTRDKKTIMAGFGLNSFQAEDHVNLVSNFSTSDIEKSIALASEYDLKSKGINSATNDNAELIKELLVKML